jgi:GNAT superfamily N-acetyltransferase
MVAVRRLRTDDLELLNDRLPVWNRVEYARRLAAQERGLLVQMVAWEDEIPVGRAMLVFPGHDDWSISAHREGCVEIRDVEVVEACRRRGIGRLLMKALETRAREAGASRIGLMVGLEDRYAAARRLYASMNYARVHGPFVSSVSLDTDRGRVAVCGVAVYLAKGLLE